MRSGPLRRATAVVVVTLVTAALTGASANATIPDEGTCPALGGRPGGPTGEDAAPVLLREGMVLEHSDLILLRQLIPAEVWRQRNVFFFDGMRMEIGPCHRRYRFPTYFSEATEQFAGQAGVDEDGNLWGYVAGTPFPAESIAKDDPDAAVKWAWNMEQRHRGSGPHGSFQITDMPSRMGGVQVYTGSFFHLRTRHRADLPDNEFNIPGEEKNLWIGGGNFDTPFNARHLAWRQMRPVKAERRYSEPDSTFVYVPTMRKVRRSATPWVDGMYMPRYRIGGDSGGGSIPVGGGNGFLPAGSVSPTSAMSAAITEHLPVGFNDLAIRPNAYTWRILGEREVLAPINATRSGYPYEKERNFGSWGLSVGSDRWDVRYAVVIEGISKATNQHFRTLTVYIDHQTKMPLYWITRRSRGLLVEIGIPVHRFSGDVVDYPSWPGPDRAQIFDPVASVFYHAADGGSGWRRESYDITSVPPPRRSLRKWTTTDTLIRGH